MDRAGRPSSSPTSSSSAGETTDLTANAARHQTPSNDQPRPFWSSYDTYTPVSAEYQPLVDPKDVPVAPGDLLNINDGAAAILSQPSLVVVRQLEMMSASSGG